MLPILTINRRMLSRSKKLFFILTFCLLFGAIFFKHAGAAPVSIDNAEFVTNNFLTHLHTSHTVASIDPIDYSGQPVGYLVRLSPQGYILIAGDDIRVPVKAYSLSSTFHALPSEYTNVLLNELEVVPTQQFKSSTPPEEINSTYWQFLTQSSMPSLKIYNPGTFLLSSQWGQGHPYNKFFPLSDDSRTVTGCVQTAVAQLMFYHQYPDNGSGVFTHNWNSQTLTAVMNRPFNWDIMPDNALASTTSQQDEVAALMRDLGVMNEATYGVSSTSAYFHRENFERAFGYAPISSMLSSHTEFLNTITSEVDNFRPVLLSLPGHLTVADGYRIDPTGKSIHVNMGWNGADDDFYFLDETLYAGGYEFPPSHTIYYNLKPCEEAECQDPYPPEGNNVPPQIKSPLEDIAMYGSVNIRIDGYDRDGDDVTFSAGSTCNSLQVSMNDNILTLNSTTLDTYCRVRVLIQSHDGVAAKTFNVLTIGSGTYIGSEYEISGQFADGTEIDTYRLYLNGITTISGDRGYSNQAFYLWVKDDANVTTIVAATNEDLPIAYDFPSGYYTVSASLRSTTGYFFPYEEDMSNYILSVTSNVSIETIAASLDLIRIPGDLNGDDFITLADSILSLSVLSGLTAVADMAVADVNFDGRIGLAEAIFTLRASAGL